MKRATFVVTMMLLLGSASVATAECAWVLWYDNAWTTPPEKQVHKWAVSSGHVTHAECIAERDEKFHAVVSAMKNLPSTKQLLINPERGGYSWFDSDKGT